MKSLYARLSYPVMLVLGLAVVSVIAFAVGNIHWFIAPDIRRITTDLVDSKSNEVSYWLETRIAENTRLAEEIVLETGTQAEIARALPALQAYQARNSNVYESMGIVSTDGISYITSGDVFDVGNRDYYAALQEDGVAHYVSNVIVSRADNGASVLLILTKLYSQSGEVTGYLSAAVSVEYLTEIVSRANIYDFPVQLVVLDDGQALASSGFEEGQLRERSTLFSCTVASNPRWAVEMLVPNRFLNRQINLTVGLMALFGAGVFLAATYISRRHAARLAAPITALEGHMHQLEQGEFVPITPDTGCTELCSLGHSYNHMLEVLQDLISQVRREQQQKQDAEYQALCAQIKPHFLYNTLETIQSMVIEGEPERAEEMIGDLAVFFRTSLVSEAKLIPLADELGHLESYLRIQLMRYEGRFTYAIHPGDVPLSLPIMKFTLQPLVENAINHGIRSMIQPGHIDIVLSMTVQQCYTVSVCNTFGELDERKIAGVNARLEAGEGASNQGHGIFNVNRRLRLEFGDGCGVSLNREESRVVACVRHPILPAEKNGGNQ